jgi:hypothetical protein
MALVPNYRNPELYDYKDPHTGVLYRCTEEEFMYRKQQEIAHYQMRANYLQQYSPSVLDTQSDPKQATPQPNPVLLLGE